MPVSSQAQGTAREVARLVGSVHLHLEGTAAAMSAQDAKVLLSYAVNGADTMVVATPTKVTVIKLNLPKRDFEGSRHGPGVCSAASRAGRTERRPLW